MGQSAELVNDVLTAKEIVDSMMSEAIATLRAKQSLISRL